MKKETEKMQSKWDQFSRFLKNIIESANVWINVLDEKRNVVIWNKEAERISGYSKEEVLGSDKIWGLLYPENSYREKMVQKTNSIIKNDNGARNYETTIRCKDGKRKVISWYSRHIIDERGKIVGLVTTGRDVTEQKITEKKLKEALKKVRKILGAVIKVLSLVVEKKDPYTAGHQRRVSDLARAIASDMDLSEEKIEAIRTAALLHDIGKIRIPAEILTKPARLNDMEFFLVKAHPQIACEIIKDIEFPWPITDIILQHHERLDGSGYPQGLKDDEILLEARILAVADVVEAMSFHRPYRPSLGLKKALEEIERNRRKLYDPDVVDACLKLFRMKEFKFD